MTREFFERLAKIFDGFRREIDCIDKLTDMKLPYGERLKILQAQYDVIIELLDVQGLDSPYWRAMPFGEKIERLYLLAKSELDMYRDRDARLEAASQHGRIIDLGGLG